MAHSQEEELSFDESVILVPVEDILSINYTSDMTKSVTAEKYAERVPVVKPKGCCGTCCASTPEPEIRTKIIEKKGAQRTVTINIEYSLYSNLHTPSNVRVLPEADRAQFYKDNFKPNTKLQFYLVRNAEYGPANFHQKRVQAANLCRLIMQLKGMSAPNPNGISAISHPGPQELQQIFTQPAFGAIGDIYQERLHSIQTEQDFGTHVPVPIKQVTTVELEEVQQTKPRKKYFT